MITSRHFSRKRMIFQNICSFIEIKKDFPIQNAIKRPSPSRNSGMSSLKIMFRVSPPPPRALLSQLYPSVPHGAMIRPALVLICCQLHSAARGLVAPPAVRSELLRATVRSSSACSAAARGSRLSAARCSTCRRPPRARSRPRTRRPRTPPTATPAAPRSHTAQRTT